jgi:predicted  nucleic acid-binding Zn-ribbon protein
MNDAVAEKLVQRVINLIEEVNDVNLVVRGITPPQAIVNKIHERIDILLAGIQQIEKKLNLDERRLTELENQTKSLKDEMEVRKKAMSDMEQKIIKNNAAMEQSFYARLETMDNHAQGRFKKMEETFQSTFWTQKWWLIVLSAVLATFAIIMITR